MDTYEDQELERLFGSNPRIQTTLEQTCDIGRSYHTTKETEPVFRDKQSLLGHVVQCAKSLGTWIERIEEHVKEMIGNGQEEVPLTIKISGTSFLMLVLQNRLFTDSRE